MSMRISHIIVATILTFLGTVFCGTLMTLPSVYASEPAHCTPSTTHQHEADQNQNVPCHGGTSDHHQLDSATLQKNAVDTIDGGAVTKVLFHQPLQEVLIQKDYFSQHFGYMHERSRYRAQHIQTRKKE